ncbi:hypothetical protein [Nocardia sp. BMG111209]|uniref:hypothetical protein n=1 Tax=Nocardia sp. BMG111209 TaxID=1160137 RepID=UPI000361292D|nr:hypothetical protein [Nocardia sp. BMG111209]
MPDTLLPAEFADLEPFAETWCLATEPERWNRRMAGTITEMEAFYRVGFPLLPDAIAHCDKFPVDDLPEDANNLLHLIYSIIMVAMCVEIWHQPQVIDSADAQIHRLADPVP